MATFRAISRNYMFLKQQFTALATNTSVLAKIICSIIILCHFLSYSDFMIEVLSVTPGYFLPPTFRIYSALTFCFLELHIWEIVIDILALVLCGKLIEPLWGNFEMFIFFGIVNFSVALLTAFFYLFLYICTSNPELLFNIHIHGLAGYIAALSVAVKQMMPEHLVFRSPLGKMTNRNIPLSVLAISVVLYLFGLIEGTYPTMYASGFLISWIYLRFYQRHSNGTRGDMAESFCFANFFPTVLQPTVAVLSNTLYGALVQVRLCQRPVRKYDLGAPSAITISLPGSDPHDMDRRREKALKALSERLNRVESIPGNISVPSWSNQQPSVVAWDKPVTIGGIPESPTTSSSDTVGLSSTSGTVRVPMGDVVETMHSPSPNTQLP